MIKPVVLRLSIDLQNVDRPHIVNVKQESNACRLIVNLLNGGAPYEIGQNASVTYNQKTEGAVVYSTVCKVENNQIVLNLPKECTSVEGVSTGEFTISDSFDNSLTTPSFTLNVHPTLMVEYATSAVASDSFGILEQAINSAQNAIANANAATESANTIREEVETKLANGDFNGKSAYEIAKDKGFKGSEEQWLTARNPKVEGNILVLPFIEIGE